MGARNFSLVVVVAAGILAGGCSHEAIQSQEWWNARRDQAKAKLLECNAMAEAERMANANCSRALTAVTLGANAGTEVLPPAESWVKREKPEN